MVVQQCDLMLRLRRLDGLQGDERLTIDWSPKGQRQLFAHLHGDRRQRHAVEDGVGHSAGTDGRFVGEPEHHCER